MLAYGCETWANAKVNYSKLSKTERKIHREIFGPVYNMETETYEKRHNKDLQNPYGRPNILSYCRRKRIEWAGHVWRAEGKIIKRVTDGNVVGKRPIGRPRTRWKDIVTKDIKPIHESKRIKDVSDRIR